MARPNTHYETKKKELIKLSLELFMEKGYEKTTITEIMRAAQISKGGMYHYFASKEEILDAVITYGLQQPIKQLEKNLAKLPIEEKLIYFIRFNDFNSFTQKLLHYQEENSSSIVGYRIREKNIELCAPLLTKIFEEGITFGLYKCCCPNAMADIFMLLTKAIAENHYLYIVEREKSQERLNAALQLFHIGLSPSTSHFKKIEGAILDLTNRK